MNRQLEGRIDWVSLAVDIDNDNTTGNELDFDLLIGFQGEGFDCTDQITQYVIYVECLKQIAFLWIPVTGN